MATVYFRGPMLFCLSKKNGGYSVNEIVIPDAHVPGSHHDGDRARMHYTQLLVVDSNGPTYQDLSGKGKSITIVGDNSTEDAEAVASLYDEYSGKARLDLMIPDGSLVRKTPPPGAPAKVKLRGGSLSASVATAMPLIIPERGSANPLNTHCLPTLAVWSADSGYYEIDGTQREITPDMELYIYNWDHDEPHPDDLKAQITPINTSVPFVDRDAKWVYKLFKPVKGGWPEWLKKSPNKHLPVPYTIGANPLTSEASAKADMGTSTCDGFVYVA